MEVWELREVNAGKKPVTKPPGVGEARRLKRMPKNGYVQFVEERQATKLRLSLPAAERKRTGRCCGTSSQSFAATTAPRKALAAGFRGSRRCQEQKHNPIPGGNSQIYPTLFWKSNSKNPSYGLRMRFLGFSHLLPIHLQHTQNRSLMRLSGHAGGSF